MKSATRHSGFNWMSAFVLVIATQFTHAQSWQATVGSQTAGNALQVMAFLPNEVWIHAGDTVTWNFAADAVHTVTFLTKDQVRPGAKVGCPGTTPEGSPFDGTTCVNGGRMTNGQTYSVSFPAPGNYKLVCLVHPSMTGTVHVLDPSEPLPHDQAFYDAQAVEQRTALLKDGGKSDPHHVPEGNEVVAGFGEIVATAGGAQNSSFMRFMDHDKVIHVGDTVEWINDDPVEPHTMTFGAEPSDPVPPSSNVTVDPDGARRAIINSPRDNVHSGWIVASGHERTGMPQAPLGVTRFRVTFTTAGIYHYICALHDEMGMKGRVIVLP